MIGHPKTWQRASRGDALSAMGTRPRGARAKAWVLALIHFNCLCPLVVFVVYSFPPDGIPALV